MISKFVYHINNPLSHTQLFTHSSYLRETKLERERERVMGKEAVNGGVDEVLEWSSLSSSYIDNSSSKRLPLLSLNHVSYVCRSVRDSVKFYEDVLGFVLIQRPSSFDFEGAWLFNHGIGIHLLQVEDVKSKKGKINPKDCHISFQCSDMDLIIQKLKDMNIEYATALVQEGGIMVDQLFFHDPDGYMIEICNCQNLPVLPISSCPLKRFPTLPKRKEIEIPSSDYYDAEKVAPEAFICADFKRYENFLVDMMGISF